MQAWIVALIVACAGWAVAKRYAPNSLRQAVRAWNARAARRLGWKRMAKRLETNQPAASSCGDGCRSCGGCGSARPASPDKPVTVAFIKRQAATQR